jgi:hypothetical protein
VSSHFWTHRAQSSGLERSATLVSWRVTPSEDHLSSSFFVFFHFISVAFVPLTWLVCTAPCGLATDCTVGVSLVRQGRLFIYFLFLISFCGASTRSLPLRLVLYTRIGPPSKMEQRCWLFHTCVGISNWGDTNSLCQLMKGLQFGDDVPEVEKEKKKIN